MQRLFVMAALNSTVPQRLMVTFNYHPRNMDDDAHGWFLCLNDVLFLGTLAGQEVVQGEDKHVHGIPDI